jgi:hypothetical protein
MEDDESDEWRESVGTANAWVDGVLPWSSRSATTKGRRRAGLLPTGTEKNERPRNLLRRASFSSSPDYEFPQRFARVARTFFR